MRLLGKIPCNENSEIRESSSGSDGGIRVVVCGGVRVLLAGDSAQGIVGSWWGWECAFPG